MFRSAKALFLVLAAGCATFAQTPPTAAAPDKEARADHHFAMGRLYEGLAELEGAGHYIPQAIEQFQEALKLDLVRIILEELTDWGTRNRPVAQRRGAGRAVAPAGPR